MVFGRPGESLYVQAIEPGLKEASLPSFGPDGYHYQAFACYDILDGGKQELSEYGIWTGDTLVFTCCPLKICGSLSHSQIRS